MIKRNRLVTALCVGCTLLTSTSSWATTIDPGQGSLSINQGQGFKPIQTSVSGKVGDSVMVGPGGAATITYDDGCKVDVKPGAVATIAPLSPCASGSNAQTNWCDPSHPEQHCGWGWQDALFWSLFITTGVIIGIGASRSGEGFTSHPASH